MVQVHDETEPVRVMIRCQATNRAIATGLETIASVWKDRPIGINKVFCPECRGVHAWKKSDAYLETRIAL